MPGLPLQLMEDAALVSRFTGHKEPVYALASGLRKGQFFSAGGDGWVVEWDLEKPTEGRLLARMSGTVYALCLIPEFNLLSVSVNKNGFHFLDLDSGKVAFSFAGAESNWFRMEKTADGRLLAMGSSGRLAILDLKEKAAKFLQAGSGDLRALTIFQDNSGFAFGGSDSFIRLFDQDAQSRSLISETHSNTIFGLAAYPDGQHFVSCGRDARLILHERQDLGEWTMKKAVPAHLFGIHDVRLHPEKPILASCSMDKTVKIWDAIDLRLLRVLDRARHGGHGHSVNQLCWLAESDLLLSCSDDRSVSAWNIYR